MVLFGVIQMASNRWRSALWFRCVDWGIVWRFRAGSTLSFLLMRSLALLPSKAPVYLTLGLLPFLADLVPRRVSLDIARPGVAYAAGALITVPQQLAGAAGHILDVFFQRSPLDGKAVVATKTATQVSGHVYRILYFGTLAATFDVTIPWWAYLAAIGLSLAGTLLTAAVLTRMSDTGFCACGAGASSSACASRTWRGGCASWQCPEAFAGLRAEGRAAGRDWLRYLRPQRTGGPLWETTGTQRSGCAAKTLLGAKASTQFW